MSLHLPTSDRTFHQSVVILVAHRSKSPHSLEHRSPSFCSHIDLTTSPISASDLPPTSSARTYSSNFLSWPFSFRTSAESHSLHFRISMLGRRGKSFPSILAYHLRPPRKVTFERKTPHKRRVVLRIYGTWLRRVLDLFCVVRSRLPVTPSGHAIRRAIRFASATCMWCEPCGAELNDLAHATSRLLDSFPDHCETSMSNAADFYSRTSAHGLTTLSQLVRHTYPTSRSTNGTSAHDLYTFQCSVLLSCPVLSCWPQLFEGLIALWTLLLVQCWVVDLNFPKTW